MEFKNKLPLPDEMFMKICAKIDFMSGKANFAGMEYVYMIGRDPNIRFTVAQICVLRNKFEYYFFRYFP